MTTFITLYMCLISVVIAVALSCCIPEKFEGHVGIKFGVVDYGQLIAGWEFYNFSYDVLEKKIALVGHIGFERSEWYEHILLDYSSGKQYTDKAGTCTITNLTGSPFTCIPSNSTIKRSAYFGMGSNKIDIEIYEILNDHSSIEISVLKDSCVPVTEYLNYNGTIAELHYMDVKPGIRNKKVFDVPLACQTGFAISNSDYTDRPFKSMFFNK